MLEIRKMFNNELIIFNRIQKDSGCRLEWIFHPRRLKKRVLSFFNADVIDTLRSIRLYMYEVLLFDRRFLYLPRYYSASW